MRSPVPMYSLVSLVERGVLMITSDLWGYVQIGPSLTEEEYNGGCIYAYMHADAPKAPLTRSSTNARSDSAAGPGSLLAVWQVPEHLTDGSRWIPQILVTTTFSLQQMSCLLAVKYAAVAPDFPRGVLAQSSCTGRGRSQARPYAETHEQAPGSRGDMESHSSRHVWPQVPLSPEKDASARVTFTSCR